MQKDYTIIQHQARIHLGLTFIEYVIADEIYNLSNNDAGWCYKSKAAIAKRFGIGQRSVYLAINKLVELGLVQRNGDNNQLRTTSKWYAAVVSADTAKSAEYDTAENAVVLQKLQSGTAKSAVEHTAKSADKSINNKNINKLPVTTNVVGSEPAAYGNAEINGMFAYWQEKTGYEITGNKQRNRYAVNNLLKKHGTDKLRKLVDGAAMAQTTQYAPRIADFCALQAKMADLLAWGRSQLSAELTQKGVDL